MKIAYYGKNDQKTYYINSIKHGFIDFDTFEEMFNEVIWLRGNGFLLANEYPQNLSIEELQKVKQI